jgi:hypothetical protein
MAMAEMWRRRHELFQVVKPAAQVHDSVVLRTARPDLTPSAFNEGVFLPSEHAAVTAVRRIMAEFPKYKLQKLGLLWHKLLPLRVDVEAGRTWGSIKPVNMETNQYETSE